MGAEDGQRIDEALLDPEEGACVLGGEFGELAKTAGFEALVVGDDGAGLARVDSLGEGLDERTRSPLSKLR
jgi:hypothetical protein